MCNKKSFLFSIPFLICLLQSIIGFSQDKNLRNITSLNGTWQVAQTSSFNKLPDKYEHTTPVPGLIDMATPAFDTTRNLMDKVY